MDESNRALIVVDVQNDFCPGGSLAVEGGDEVAQRITNYLRLCRSDYRVAVGTKDWHPDDEANFLHFSQTPNYIDTWPPHCVQNTWGAEFHPNLDESLLRHVFRKGETSAAYSGFEGHNDLGEMLGGYLNERGVNAVDVVGLATDYCVQATAIDASELGFTTTVLLDLTAAVHPDALPVITTIMMGKGVAVANALI